MCSHQAGASPLQQASANAVSGILGALSDEDAAALVARSCLQRAGFRAALLGLLSPAEETQDSRKAWTSAVMTSRTWTSSWLGSGVDCSVLCQSCARPKRLTQGIMLGMKPGQQMPAFAHLLNSGSFYWKDYYHGEEPAKRPLATSRRALSGNRHSANALEIKCITIECMWTIKKAAPAVPMRPWSS